MKRWRTALLGSAAAVAMLAGEPARAVVINDQLAAAFGGAANYYDASNQYPQVVSLFSPGVPGVSMPGSQCTGSLINSRTILTAAHCFVPQSFGIPSISFANTSSPGAGITSFVRNPGFNAVTLDNDIAVISLAQPVPVTTVRPVTLLQPGQPGSPTVGTTVTMVGYGVYGTGSNPPTIWIPVVPGTPPPPDVMLNEPSDNRRRVGTSSLSAIEQFTFFSQFRNQASAQPLEAGLAPGDSGGPLFAVINGQLVQIGIARSVTGAPPIILFCGDSTCPAGTPSDDPKVTGRVASLGYGNESHWTPVDDFFDWINQNNPLRQVTAKAGNSNWNNPLAWSDPFADPARPNGAVPDNTRGSVDINANQAARYYDVTLSNPGTITLDMNPQIDTLSPGRSRSSSSVRSTRWRCCWAPHSPPVH